MRIIYFVVALALVVGCGGGKSGGSTPPVTVKGYSAARWIPPKATYAITATSVRAAQQAFRDVLASAGEAAGISAGEVGREIEEVIAINPISPDALAEIGIDLDGGFAMFSHQLNPTFVAHLNSASDFRAFIDKQKNLKLQSIVVEGTEVFSAPIDGGRVSWAIADNWLWVHFELLEKDNDASWFTASKKSSGGWSVDLSWVKNMKPSIIGFLDTAHFVADATREFPEAAACTSLLALGGTGGLGDLAVAASADTKQASFQVALDVGNQIASGIQSSVKGPPEGWGTSTAQVPIAAQWNLDLSAVRARFEPCLQAMDFDLRLIDELGIRTARGFVRTFEPDDKKGTGAVALDLIHKDFFAEQLDQIPLRSTFERKRTFGPYAGKSLAIPMFLTVDYVLNDTLALAGVGDGLLAVLVGKGGTVPGPIAELSLQPLGLTQESWIELLRLLDVNLGDAKRIAAQLHQWREAHVNLTLDGTRVVLGLSGTRR